MALRGFTYYSKEQYSTWGQKCHHNDTEVLRTPKNSKYSTSGQTCQWWDNDMALRGFTYTLLQRTVQYIGSNVGQTDIVSGGITIWR